MMWLHKHSSMKLLEYVWELILQGFKYTVFAWQYLHADNRGTFKEALTE